MSWFGGASFLRRAIVQPMAEAFERAYPNRAQKGLYGGRQINFGNNVSHSKRR